MMAMMRRGTLNRSSVGITAISSVGATIAPNVNATAHPIPGMIACPVDATPMIVAMTSPKAIGQIHRAFARISSVGAVTDYQYNRGGRKMTRTRSAWVAPCRDAQRSAGLCPRGSALLLGRLLLRQHEPHDHVPGVPDASDEQQNAGPRQSVERLTFPQEQGRTGAHVHEITDHGREEIPCPVVHIDDVLLILLPHERQR